MQSSKLENLIGRVENYLECWKQFNHYMNLARFKKFTADDENQFLEVKSIITQELELILNAFDTAPVTRDEVHGLIAVAPSIRYLSECPESGLREAENRWHKHFITLQSVLGQLKVKRDAVSKQSWWSSMFGKPEE